jgi:hypothetical protein
LPHTSDQIISGTKRWLSSKYPSSADAFSTFLFGPTGTGGYVGPNELTSEETQLAPFGDSDEEMATLCAITVQVKLRVSVGAVLGLPSYSGSPSDTLTGSVVQGVLRGNETLPAFNLPWISDSSDRTLLQSTIADAVKAKVSDMLAEQKYTIVPGWGDAANKLLFGAGTFAGIATGLSVASDAITGVPLNPAAVTLDYAMNVVSYTASTWFSNYLSKQAAATFLLSEQAAAIVGGALGAALFGLFISVNTANERQDNPHPGGAGGGQDPKSGNGGSGGSGGLIGTGTAGGGGSGSGGGASGGGAGGGAGGAGGEGEGEGGGEGSGGEDSGGGSDGPPGHRPPIRLD